MVTAPLMDPLMEGVKVRLRVQVAPAANAPVQPVAVKSPLAVTEEIVKELALLFFYTHRLDGACGANGLAGERDAGRSDL